MVGFNHKKLTELLEKTEAEQGFVEYFTVSQSIMDPVKTAGQWGIPMSEQASPIPYVKADGVEGFVLLNQNEDYPLFQVYPKDAFTVDPSFSHTEKPLSDRLERQAQKEREQKALSEAQKERERVATEQECKKLLNDMEFVNSHFGEVFDTTKERASFQDSPKDFLRSNMFKKHVVNKYVKTFRNIIEKIEIKEGGLESICDMRNIGTGDFMKDFRNIEDSLCTKLIQSSFGFKVDVETVQKEHVNISLKNKSGDCLAKCKLDFEEVYEDYDGEGNSLNIVYIDEDSIPENHPLIGLVEDLQSFSYLENYDPGLYYEPYENDYEVKDIDLLSSAELNKHILSRPIIAQQIARWVSKRDYQNEQKVGHSSSVPSL